MECFNHQLSENISYVPITKIGISTPIINTVRELTGSEPKDYIIDSSAPQFGRLVRLDSFTNFNNDILPPVVLKFLKYEGLYTIVDGRHRVALSLANGKTHIPAKIIN